MSISSNGWEAQLYRHGGASGSSTVVLGGEMNSNSKLRRRWRASRKAPTTLLKASRANFRELVQQFTGFQAGVAGVALGSHKGPVTLSFGQTGDDIHNNHPSVMLPFSGARRSPFPAAELTEIQNLVDEDLNYDVQDLAMEFYSSNGDYTGAYFP